MNWLFQLHQVTIHARVPFFFFCYNMMIWWYDEIVFMTIWFFDDSTSISPALETSFYDMLILCFYNDDVRILWWLFYNDFEMLILFLFLSTPDIQFLTYQRNMMILIKPFYHDPMIILRWFYIILMWSFYVDFMIILIQF